MQCSRQAKHMHKKLASAYQLLGSNYHLTTARIQQSAATMSRPAACILHSVASSADSCSYSSFSCYHNQYSRTSWSTALIETAALLVKAVWPAAHIVATAASNIAPAVCTVLRAAHTNRYNCLHQSLQLIEQLISCYQNKTDRLLVLKSAANSQRAAHIERSAAYIWSQPFARPAPHIEWQCTNTEWSSARIERKVICTNWPLLLFALQLLNACRLKQEIRCEYDKITNIETNIIWEK